MIINDLGSDFIKIIIESGYPFYPVPTLSDSQVKNTISSAIELNMLTVVHVSDLDDGMKAFRYGANGLAHLWTKNENYINAEQLKELNKKYRIYMAERSTN